VLFSMRVRSTRYGEFNPFDPPQIPGAFPFILSAPPVDIAAPPEVVWAVLTDAEAYPTWCPFTRRIETDWQLDSPIALHLNWDETSMGDAREVQHERIAVFEPSVALSWGGDFYGGIVHAERTQALQRTEEGTRFYNYDRFSGVAAPFVRLLYGAAIVRCFSAVSHALARRVVAAG